MKEFELNLEEIKNEYKKVIETKTDGLKISHAKATIGREIKKLENENKTANKTIESLEKSMQATGTMDSRKEYEEVFKKANETIRAKEDLIRENNKTIEIKKENLEILKGLNDKTIEQAKKENARLTREINKRMKEIKEYIAKFGIGKQLTREEQVVVEKKQDELDELKAQKATNKKILDKFIHDVETYALENDLRAELDKKAKKVNNKDDKTKGNDNDDGRDDDDDGRDDNDDGRDNDDDDGRDDDDDGRDDNDDGRDDNDDGRDDDDDGRDDNDDGRDDENDGRDDDDDGRDNDDDDGKGKEWGNAGNGELPDFSKFKDMRMMPDEYYQALNNGNIKLAKLIEKHRFEREDGKVKLDENGKPIYKNNGLQEALKEYLEVKDKEQPKEINTTEFVKNMPEELKKELKDAGFTNTVAKLQREQLMSYSDAVKIADEILERPKPEEQIEEPVTEEKKKNFRERRAEKKAKKEEAKKDEKSLQTVTKNPFKKIFNKIRGFFNKAEEKTTEDPKPEVPKSSVTFEQITKAAEETKENQEMRDKLKRLEKPESYISVATRESEYNAYLNDFKPFEVPDFKTKIEVSKKVKKQLEKTTKRIIKQIEEEGDVEKKSGNANAEYDDDYYFGDNSK